MAPVLAKIFLWFVVGLVSVELVNEALYALMPSAAQVFEVGGLFSTPGAEEIL